MSTMHWIEVGFSGVAFVAFIAMLFNPKNWQDDKS